MKRLFFVLCLFVLLECNGAARILAVFPCPSFSHQVVFRPLTQELVKRGHEVVVITPDPAFPKGDAPANMTEIDVHDVSYTLWRKEVSRISSGRREDARFNALQILRKFTPLFEAQLMTKEVQDLIHDEKQRFDLIFIEAVASNAIAYSYIFKAPVIQFSSLGPFEDSAAIIGAPIHPLLYPISLNKKIYNLTWWDKINELYFTYLYRNMLYEIDQADHKMLQKHFGVEIPSLRELRNNVQMLFLNTYPIWDNNRPTPPGVLYLGGFQSKPPQPLPQDLESFLNSSINGVIYVSFGSNVLPSMLPPKRIQVLLNVFSELPYDILWKWDKDSLPGKSDNIRIGKWFPQSDLLRHPKVKLFVTQAGLQSTDEAITAGVPLIGIPMLGDQWYNAEKYVHHKIGLHLDMDTLTEDELRRAVNIVIDDESYRRNINRFHDLVTDLPQSPLERAVWWTEYVIRHSGALYLRSPAANMNWREYLEADLLLVVLACALSVVFAVVAVTWYAFRLLKLYFVFKVKKN